MPNRKPNPQIANTIRSRGIYSIRAAAMLLGENSATVQRWAFGYRRRGIPYRAAIETSVPAIDGTQVLTFLELVELLFIQGLLKAGLSWPKVREASRTAAELLSNEPHPFATRRWFFDAASLYVELGETHNDRMLVEIGKGSQIAMEAVLRPYLQQIDFGIGGVAERWYPQGRGTPVVVDPARAFGMPVTETSGVPTEALAALHAAGDSVEKIAAWFRVSESEVKAAVGFEHRMARSN
ncbi:MAG: DUF433 domain-containing protein [Gemmatimonadaceae bacterium]|jgi:uncharacterized protein (DUF433 family)|nr:DUF433 domain-containing protein [Gemmatimonadaceae bacterium]